MSRKKLWSGKRAWLYSGLLLLGALPLLINSCGSSNGYDVPSTTQTATALITPAMLKEWIDKGLVNGTGFDRVVILDTNNSTTAGSTYADGHIRGAFYLNPADLSQSRSEGIALLNVEVLTGTKMDALIQKYGINGSTTIVFTGSSVMNTTRAYFAFRYWGFPKNRLKLLDGLNGTLAAANTYANLYGLTTDNPPPAPLSTYSVRGNSRLRHDLRVSLAEMINYAEGNVPNTLAVDDRSLPTAGSYAGIRGSTTGLYLPGTGASATNDHVVFEGRIRGAKALVNTALYAGTFFNTADQLKSSFTTIGLDSTKTAYVYCRQGMLATIMFFALDGILGWPAAVYDGSWSQWGQLSANTSMGGQLDPGSRWRTDIPSRSELIAYNLSARGPAGFLGTGLNDLTTGETPVINPSSYRFVVEINGIAPDSFRWSSDGGTNWTLGGVITGAAQTLIDNVTIEFAATAGHTLNDQWIFTAGLPLKPVEQLTADGSTCSATYAINGTITNSSGGITACDGVNLPTSFDESANRIEEEDKVYMNSGTGGTGGTGGGGGGC